MKNKPTHATTLWRGDNKERFAEYYFNYYNNEKNYIQQSIGQRFRPSRNPKWVVNLTKDEFYAELILHIEVMKDKFPDSDGRLCRICYKPWTYTRGKPNKENLGTGTSGATSKRPFVFTNFSIDRFDTTKGYEKNNVIFCCKQCNHAKNSSEKWMWLRLLEIDKELNESKTDQMF